MKKEDGGPAFPTSLENAASFAGCQSTGMTLRDYFAAKVMPALIVPFSGNGRFLTSNSDAPALREEIAKQAYAMADAMLAERNK